MSMGEGQSGLMFVSWLLPWFSNVPGSGSVALHQCRMDSVFD